MKKVLNLVDSYIENSVSFNHFCEQINLLYGSDNPEWKSMSEDEQNFIYEVYEKSTYSGEGLPKNDPDRKFGLIDEEDLREWLKELKEKNIQLCK